MNMLGGMSVTITSFTLFSTSPGESLGRSAEHGAGSRHHQGGGYALVRNITDDEAEPAVVEIQEVVEIAAHLAGGLVVGRYLVAGSVGYVLGEEGLLDQARDPELLLDALAFLGLLLLLADELGYLHGRRGLGGQVVQQLPVVSRVLLLGEARPQVEEPDQLALAHQRHDHLDVGFFHGPQGGRIEVELVDLYHPRGAGEVSHDGIVGRYLQFRPSFLKGSLHDGRGDLLLGLLLLVTPEETLPETLSASLLCRHVTSSSAIVAGKRLPDVTKSATTRRVQKTRIIAIYFSSASSTAALRAMPRLHAWSCRSVLSRLLGVVSEIVGYAVGPLALCLVAR